MGFVWDNLALPGLVGAALQLVLAGLVLALGPRRAGNRWMAIFMACDAAIPATFGILLLIPNDAGITFVLSVMAALLPTFTLAMVLAGGALLCFLSTTEMVPAWRWLPMARGIVFGVCAAAGILFAVTSPVLNAQQDTAPNLTPQLAAVLWFMLVVSISLVASVIRFVRAPRRSTVRRQARSYGIAFGLRDGLLLTFAGLTVLRPDLLSGLLGNDVRVAMMVPSLISILFAILMALGIATTGLFDDDHRLQRALRGSSVAGVLAILFFIIEQSLQQMLPVGGFVPSFVGAGAIALLFLPVHRLIGGGGKARQYRLAVEAALEVGGISAAERAVLDRHATKLGLSPRDVARIEASARAKSGSGVGDA